MLLDFLWKHQTSTWKRQSTGSCQILYSDIDFCLEQVRGLPLILYLRSYLTTVDGSAQGDLLVRSFTCYGENVSLYSSLSADRSIGLSQYLYL